MILDVRAVAPFYKNGFVVGCERTRAGVLIDPGDEVDQLLAAVKAHQLDIRHILLTHAHVDHITGVAAAKNALGAPVYLHRDDLFFYEGVVEQGAMFGLKVSRQPYPDVFYDDSRIAVRRLRGARAPHAWSLSGRGVPGGNRARRRRDTPVRWRHAVRRLDWPDRPSRG